MNELAYRSDIKRRQAAWAIRALFKELDLGSNAITVDPDNPNNWIVDDHFITALHNRHKAVELVIIGDQAEVTINDIYMVIRNDRDEFEPESHGITPMVGRDAITNDKKHDLTAIIDLPDIESFAGPIVIIPREPYFKAPKVIRSLS